MQFDKMDIREISRVNLITSIICCPPSSFQVVIYNRNTAQSRLDNFKIMVGLNKPRDDGLNIEDDENEYCGGHVPNSQLPSTVQNARVPLLEITCSSPIDGRYVTVKGTGEYLTLCEVEVFAEPSTCAHKSFAGVIYQYNHECHLSSIRGNKIFSPFFICSHYLKFFGSNSKGIWGW